MLLLSLLLLVQPLSWPDLDQLFIGSGSKEVEMRGFVYKNTDGDLFFSDDPHVRSCCIGRGGMRRDIHLVAPKNLFETGKIYTLRGDLVQLTEKEAKQVGAPFEMKNIKMSDRFVKNDKILLLVSLAGVCALLFYGIKKRLRKSLHV